MSGVHRNKFAKARRRKPPRPPAPMKVLTPAEKAAFLATRPDLRGSK